MLPIYCCYIVGNVPSGFKLLFHPFPLIRTSRAGKIFVLEFSKDGSADLEDKFAVIGVASQPVILQGGVGLSSGKVSQRYCQFHSDKILVCWDECVNDVG